MLLVSFHHQGELSRRNGKIQILQCEEYISKWLKFYVKRCHSLPSMTEIFRWEGTGQGSLPRSAGSQTWRPVSGSRALPTVRGPLLMWEGARFPDPFNCSDASVVPSLLLSSRTITLRKEGMHSCYNSSSRCFSLKASPVSLSWASFIPWTTVK